jgi:hypothetical protein
MVRAVVQLKGLFSERLKKDRQGSTEGIWRNPYSGAIPSVRNVTRTHHVLNQRFRINSMAYVLQMFAARHSAVQGLQPVQAWLQENRRAVYIQEHYDIPVMSADSYTCWPRISTNYADTYNFNVKQMRQTRVARSGLLPLTCVDNVTVACSS